MQRSEQIIDKLEETKTNPTALQAKADLINRTLNDDDVLEMSSSSNKKGGAEFASNANRKRRKGEINNKEMIVEEVSDQGASNFIRCPHPLIPRFVPYQDRFV